ncbi:OmpA family protein [Marinobacter hydrocarbonoclasticus]|nr:OmpA family protein [Marinobacter nauticus]
MRFILFISLFFLFFDSINQASANSNDAVNKKEEWTHAPYIGGRIGHNYLSDFCNNIEQGCDDNQWGMGIYGGYQFTPHWGVELGITDYKDYRATLNSGKFSAGLRGYDIAVRYNWLFGSQTLGFVKVGGSWQDVDRALDGQDLKGQSAWSTLGEFGLEYAVMPALSVRLAQQMLLNSLNGPGYFTSLGLTYYFGGAPTTFQQRADKVATVDKVEKEESFPVFEPVLFDFEQTALTRKAKSQLETVAEVFKQFPYTHVRLSGHADTSGDYANNLLLSEKRAREVQEYLIQLGVPETQIDIVGYGQRNPVATNQTERGRTRNRRVEIELTRPPEP